jgi:hypothetical protein
MQNYFRPPFYKKTSRTGKRNRLLFLLDLQNNVGGQIVIAAHAPLPSFGPI